MKPIASVTLLKVALLASVATSVVASLASQAHAEVGVAAAVNVDARGRPPGAAPRVITLGTNVVFNEEISTDSAGLVQILLLDGTTFTVGPNSQLTIDEFVYDPNTGDAKVVASLTKGVFRFVGARTSQTEGGATVKTPVGTIGIRGAVTNISYDPTSGQSTAALVAGNKLTIVDANGAQRIVYETGYTAVITMSPGGGTTTTVRKSTPAETRVFQQQLSSKPGQNGGNTGTPPSDKQAGQVSQANSGLPTIMDVPGSTKPVELAEQIDEVINDKTQDIINEDIANEEQQQPNARLLTAPDTYQAYFGETFPDAGSRGLVGSNDDNDRLVRLEVEGDRLVTSDGSLDLPDLTDDQGDGPGGYEYALGEYDICDEGCYSSATLGVEKLAGVAYAGRGDFVTYLLGIDNIGSSEDNPALKPVYVIYGTPTSSGQLEDMFYGGDGIREYRLTEDPIQQLAGNPNFGIPAPFFSNELYQGDFDSIGFHTTDLLVIEPGGSETADTRGYLSWVDIQGAGSGQKSAIFLMTPNLYQNSDDDFQLDGGRRGSFRHASGATATNLRGGISTLPGATGAHFFGENADHFVIGTSIDPADTFFDSNHGGSLDQNVPGYLSDGNFSTHHVASLVNVTTQKEALSVDEPYGLKNGGADGKLTGFMAGMGETDHWGTNTQYRLTGNNLEVNFNAQDNAFAARGTVYDAGNDDPQLANILLTFGHYSEGGNEYPGAGTYVDDVHYGAVHNNGAVSGAPDDAEDMNTRIRTDGGADLPEYGFNAGSYIVSGRANPIDGYKHLESESYSCSDCDFIQWGWWGTRVQSDVDPDPDNEHIRTDYVHMGTWVAGDISTDAEIDALVANAEQIPLGATVYYSGTVIGNVARADGPNTASYIATGDLGVSYNFSDRTGDVDISNFDGNVALSGTRTIQQTDSWQTALRGVQLEGANVYAGNGSLTGTFNGAFVNNPAAQTGPNVASGVIGSFDFTGAGVNAAGTGAAVYNGID
ncbi:FecR family protein [Mesorhizobium sp. YM1C-6-2]|uniref:FecR family protein n=1 Tax=Mesorhizobium sp. YM1C-6-2 TaxID=1827501 RepID=UPI000EF205B2|nr:FecR family protein [Mesorhizobium sp. YM1C-6-2]RLP22511.1 hypothetical protein D8676_24225 [Mesorhizobium sp. YM1C-6-2]